MLYTHRPAITREMPSSPGEMLPLEEFCTRVLSLHKGTRFAGIANSRGELVAHAYRKGLKPMLSKKDATLSTFQSFLRMGTRTVLEKKLGGMVYEFEMYNKVKRATVSVRLSGSLHIFMVSFDTEVDHDRIILKKIIPLLDDLTL
jgi:hypothetical protein